MQIYYKLLLLKVAVSNKCIDKNPSVTFLPGWNSAKALVDVAESEPAQGTIWKLIHGPRQLFQQKNWIGDLHLWLEGHCGSELL